MPSLLNRAFYLMALVVRATMKMRQALPTLDRSLVKGNAECSASTVEAYRCIVQGDTEVICDLFARLVLQVEAANDLGIIAFQTGHCRADQLRFFIETWW